MGNCRVTMVLAVLQMGKERARFIYHTKCINVIHHSFVLIKNPLSRSTFLTILPQHCEWHLPAPAIRLYPSSDPPLIINYKDLTNNSP